MKGSSIIVYIAGLLILAGTIWFAYAGVPLFPMGYESLPGMMIALPVLGIISGILVLMSGYANNMNKMVRTDGAMAIVFSILGFIGGGGFPVIGAVLGIIGGLMMLMKK